MAPAVDWVNIASTFGAAIAGSWFGARATQHQTRTNILMETGRWRRERAFELLECMDEYVSYSFRRNTLSLPDRDRRDRRLLTLVSIVVEGEREATARCLADVRLLHDETQRPCPVQFPAVKAHFDALAGKVRQVLDDCHKV